MRVPEVGEGDRRPRVPRPSPLILVGIAVMFGVLAWIVWVGYQVARSDLPW
jgi:hypothetical protein